LEASDTNRTPALRVVRLLLHVYIPMGGL